MFSKPPQFQPLLKYWGHLKQLKLLGFGKQKVIWKTLYFKCFIHNFCMIYIIYFNCIIYISCIIYFICSTQANPNSSELELLTPGWIWCTVLSIQCVVTLAGGRNKEILTFVIRNVHTWCFLSLIIGLGECGWYNVQTNNNLFKEIC